MLVSKEIKQERLSICSTCPFLIKLTYSCTQCGCFMRIKSAFEDSSCPVGKW
jgi:hypothetical protein